MLTFQQCTNEQAHNVTVGFLAAAKLLSDATAYYTAQAADAQDPTDQTNLSAAALAADTQLKALNAAYDAFLNAGGVVEPPSDDEVNEVIATSSDLAQAIATGKQANDILILVEHGLLAAQKLM